MADPDLVARIRRSDLVDLLAEHLLGWNTGDPLKALREVRKRQAGIEFPEPVRSRTREVPESRLALLQRFRRLVVLHDLLAQVPGPLLDASLQGAAQGVDLAYLDQDQADQDSATDQHARQNHLQLFVRLFHAAIKACHFPVLLVQRQEADLVECLGQAIKPGLDQIVGGRVARLQRHHRRLDVPQRALGLFEQRLGALEAQVQAAHGACVGIVDTAPKHFETVDDIVLGHGRMPNMVGLQRLDEGRELALELTGVPRPVVEVFAAELPGIALQSDDDEVEHIDQHDDAGGQNSDRQDVPFGQQRPRAFWYGAE